MMNVPMFVVVFLMFLGIPSTHCTSNDPKVNQVRKWLQNDMKQKVTELHCYFHAVRIGKAANQEMVAKSETTMASLSLFGMLNMVDYPLTIGPSKSSKLLGRMQGLYASVSMEEFSFLMAMDIVFPYDPGEYNSSSLTLLGRNKMLDSYREVPIVGGSGIFRLARGVVILKTYFYDPISGNATIEVDVLAKHY